jgi:hypothetical protein
MKTMAVILSMKMKELKALIYQQIEIKGKPVVGELEARMKTIDSQHSKMLNKFIQIRSQLKKERFLQQHQMGDREKIDFLVNKKIKTLKGIIALKEKKVQPQEDKKKIVQKMIPLKNLIVINLTTKDNNKSLPAKEES